MAKKKYIYDENLTKEENLLLEHLYAFNTSQMAVALKKQFLNPNCYSSKFLSDCYRRCLSGNYRCIMSMIFNERKKRAFPFMVSCANTVPGMLLTQTSWLLYNPMSLNASPVLKKLLCKEQGNCALSLLR